MAELNPNLSPAITHQPSLLGGAENMKLLYDDTMAHLSRVRGVEASHDQAWETLRFRIAQESQTITHLAQLNVVISAQTGDTEGQQSNAPIRTAAADNVAAGSTPANRITDTTGAVAGGAVNSATAQATLNNVSAQLGELVGMVANLAALLAQTVENAKQTPAAS